MQFSIKGIDKPFKFFNCFCPSTKREYFIETESDKCNIAKAKSFGFDELEIEEEW